MKRWVWLIAMVAGCATDDLSTTEVEQNAGDYQAGDYQSGDYQAGDYQAGDYQAGDYQGTHYDSTSLTGGTLNGTALDTTSVSGTALIVWKRAGLNAWEQRFPDKICYWDFARTSSTGCTAVDLLTHPSPLTGMRFPTTMRTPTGTMQGWVQIGTSSTSLGAVKKDTTFAMWSLSGFGTGSTMSHLSSCANPTAGCRKNDDLWVYNLRLINADGTQLQFCSSNTSYALAGTWNSVGTFAKSKEKFTFACSTGTVAKCTRWGYRNWVSTATRSDGATNISLAPYHQACVRAAMADYCSNGHTFTKFHTLVDIYDFQAGNGAGFVRSINAFPEESVWDSYGASSVDHYRYEELAGTQSYGSIEDPAVGCPDRFSLAFVGDPDFPTPTHLRNDPPPASGSTPVITIASAPSCAHTALTVGKWLHFKCFGGACTNSVAYSSDSQGSLGYCTDPTSPNGWDARCVAKAATFASCTSPHSECAVGPAIPKWSSGCSAEVCNDSRYTSCCDTTSGSWTSTCTDAANTLCTGGQERSLPVLNYGFCGLSAPTRSL